MSPARLPMDLPAWTSVPLKRLSGSAVSQLSLETELSVVSVELLTLTTRTSEVSDWGWPFSGDSGLLRWLNSRPSWRGMSRTRTMNASAGRDSTRPAGRPTPMLRSGTGSGVELASVAEVIVPMIAVVRPVEMVGEVGRVVLAVLLLVMLDDLISVGATLAAEAVLIDDVRSLVEENLGVLCEEVRPGMMLDAALDELLAAKVLCRPLEVWAVLLDGLELIDDLAAELLELEAKLVAVLVLVGLAAAPTLDELNEEPAEEEIEALLAARVELEATATVEEDAKDSVAVTELLGNEEALFELAVDVNVVLGLAEVARRLAVCEAVCGKRVMVRKLSMRTVVGALVTVKRRPFLKGSTMVSNGKNSW